MKTSIEVSVLLPMYNEEKKWLELCLESLINQAFDSYEIIAILDKPDNELIKKVMSNYKDNHLIKYFVNSENLGISNTLNRGIDLAQGKYIAIMNADDISLKNRLKIQWEFLEKNKEVALVASNCNLIDELGKPLKIKDGFIESDEGIKKALKFLNPIVHPTWMGKKELFKQLRYKKIIGVEDMDFLCRLVLLGYEIKNMNEVLLCYRIRETSISSTNELIQQFLTYRLSKFFSKALALNSYDYYDNQVKKLMEGIDSIALDLKLNNLTKYFNDYKEIVQILRSGNVIKFIMKLPKIIELTVTSKHSGFFRFKIMRHFSRKKLYS